MNHKGWRLTWWGTIRMKSVGKLFVDVGGFFLKHRLTPINPNVCMFV